MHLQKLLKYKIQIPVPTNRSNSKETRSKVFFFWLHEKLIGKETNIKRYIRHQRLLTAMFYTCQCILYLFEIELTKVPPLPTCCFHFQEVLWLLFLFSLCLNHDRRILFFSLGASIFLLFNRFSTYLLYWCNLLGSFTISQQPFVCFPADVWIHILFSYCHFLCVCKWQYLVLFQPLCECSTLN